MLRAGIWVSAYVHRKYRKLLVANRSNLAGICPIGNAWSVRKLTTIDLDLWPRELFSYFFNSYYIFWMCWPSNVIFSVETSSEYLGHSLVSGSYVWGHSSEKSVAYNSKTAGRKLLGLDLIICRDNARSNSELLTSRPLTLKHIFVFFQFKLFEFWMP